jgi:hypothetical protein
MFRSEAEGLLVFEARLVTDEDRDTERVFAVNYYLTDREIAIFEKKNPRKGIDGGRFLAKMKVKDPLTGENYGDKAFYLGAQISAAGRVFELVDAPEYTLCQLEANSDRFPVADLQNAVDALSQGVGRSDVERLFKAKDQSSSGSVSPDDAKTILFGLVPQILKQTAVTLLRRFTTEGRFDYPELVGYL